MLDKFFSITSRSQGNINIYIDDCLSVLRKFDEHIFDAIITDPPYEIGLHGKDWDDSGIAFSADLWNELFRVLKPGAFVAAFAASRLYHHLAQAAEQAGLRPYPMQLWQFPQGLPKPINASNMFERESDERIIVGTKKGAGYTRSNVSQGAQDRQTWQWPIYGPPVTENGKKWQGFYYGVNTIRPAIEPIFIGQKPPDRDMKDNLAHYGVGALNIGAYQKRHGSWPEATLKYGKAKQDDHHSDHPSVKPVRLMEDLCLIYCPPGGHILDCFAGTGTTGVAADQEGFSVTLIERQPSLRDVLMTRLPRAVFR